MLELRGYFFGDRQLVSWRIGCRKESAGTVHEQMQRVSMQSRKNSGNIRARIHAVFSPRLFMHVYPCRKSMQVFFHGHILYTFFMCVCFMPVFAMHAFHARLVIHVVSCALFMHVFMRVYHTRFSYTFFMYAFHAHLFMHASMRVFVMHGLQTRFSSCTCSCAQFPCTFVLAHLFMSVFVHMKTSA